MLERWPQISIWWGGGEAEVIRFQKAGQPPRSQLWSQSCNWLGFRVHLSPHCRVHRQELWSTSIFFLNFSVARKESYCKMSGKGGIQNLQYLEECIDFC